MKLVSLDLKYFRQHRATSIKFESGLTAITGPNGAGKTTLLEAISYALFGSKVIRGAIADLPARGFAKKNTKVELCFEHSQVIYKIQRGIDSAELFSGGDSLVLAKGTKAVTDRVQDLLGMNHEEFRSTYFTEQKGLEFLSGRNGATERTRFILKMMGYDKLEKAQELLRRDRRDFKIQLQTLEASLVDGTTLQEKIQSENEVLKVLLVDLGKAEKSVNSAKQEFDRIKKEKEDLEIDARKYASLQNHLVASSTAIKMRIEQNQVNTQQITDLQAELASYEQYFSNKELSPAELEDERITCERKLKDLDEQLILIQKKWYESQASIKAENQSIERQLNDLKLKLEKWSELGSTAVCPTCEQPLGKQYEDVKEHILLEKEELQAKSSELTLKDRELQAVPQEIDAIKIEIAKQKGSLVEITSAIQKLKDKNSLLQRIEKLKQESVATQENITKLRVSEEDLKKSIKILDFDDLKYQAKIKTYDAAQGFFELARLQLVKLQGVVEKQQALLDRSNVELQTWQKNVLNIESLKRDLYFIDQSDDLLSEFRTRLQYSVRPRLSELASEFILELTDGRYSAIELSEDFTPTVIEDGTPKTVISGGEQDILDLCMRLALSQILADRAGTAIGLLILDEVFGSLDEHRRANVLSLLEKLANRFEQIILISHLDDVKEGVQHFINVEYDEGAGMVELAGIEDDFEDDVA